MSDYFLAPALVEFRDEINEQFPNRDKSSDGWIGDASHQARSSDHNPDWDDDGIVRAIDIDNNGAPGERTPLVNAVLKAAIGDPRVWYVIYNRKIYSRTYGWAARAYTGSNPHDHHIHVSLNGANGLDKSTNFSTARWFPKPRPKKHADHSPRVNNFRESGNKWNVNILDRAIRHGRRDIEPKVAAIEDAVAGLPDDVKDTRVHEFKDHFAEKRILDMALLNDAVENGRSGRVRVQRDKLRAAIKSVLRHV